MQAAPSLDIALLGLPGILLGMLLGYVFGGVSGLRAVDRLALGLVSAFIGGLIIWLTLDVYIDLTSVELVFIIASFFGGYMVGAFSNWEPPNRPRMKRHIRFDPEADDEDFDRQLEEALGGQDSRSE
jgi:fructose-specific phosphotransferase system IIC component